MGKASCLVFLVVFQLASAHGGTFNPKDEFVTDLALKTSICKAKGVYDLPLQHDDLVTASCEGTMEYRWKGLTAAAYGDATIYHYEVTKLGFQPCQVVKYWVHSHKEVILESDDRGLIGEYRVVKGHWAWKAVVPDGQGSCFN